MDDLLDAVGSREFWDGTGAEIAGSFVAVLGSLSIAYFIYWKTRAGEREDARVALEQQAETSRQLIAETAQHNRALAREQAELDACERINVDIQEVLRLLAPKIGRYNIRRDGDREAATALLGGTIIAKQDAIRTQLGRSHVEQAYDSLEAFCQWQTQHETKSDGVDRYGGHIAPEGWVEADQRAANVLGRAMARVSDALGAIRRDEPVPALHPVPTAADYDAGLARVPFADDEDDQTAPVSDASLGHNAV